MANQKQNLHTAKNNFSRLTGLVAGATLLIALVYIYHLNGFGGTSRANTTSTPSETSTPQSTSTPSETPTPRPSSTPEDTLTPEPSYNFINRLDLTDSMSLLTLVDTKGSYAEWVRKTCKVNITMAPSKIKFGLDNIPSTNTNFLAATLSTNSYETGYYQARNTQLCDRNIAKINPSEFGLQGKNDIFIIPYIWEDSVGNQIVFQFAQGKSGFESMKQTSFFSDKNGPRLEPIDHMPLAYAKNYLPVPEKAGGPDDVRKLADDSKAFYEVQGISQAEVVEIFKRIGTTNIINPEDKKLIESLVFLAKSGGFVTSN